MTNTIPSHPTALTHHLRDDLHEHATRLLEGTGIDLDTALRIATQTDDPDQPAADPSVIPALRDGWTSPDHASTHPTTTSTEDAQ